MAVEKKRKFYLMWSERVAHYTVVEAESEYEAAEMWHRGATEVWGYPEDDPGTEVVKGSLKVKEIKQGGEKNGGIQQSREDRKAKG